MNWYKNYMGYVREILAYSIYPFARKSIPEMKFVIFTIGRSGSTLLVDLLHSHASIFCDNELFRRRLFDPFHYLQARERLSNKKVYGFKLNTYHFRIQRTPDPARLLRSIIDLGYKIIGLERRNILRQVISHMFALETNQFHIRGEEKSRNSGRFHLKVDQLEQELELFEGYHALYSRLLEPYTYLPIVYEDDLLNPSQHQITVDRVCNFLDVSSAYVKSDLKKTTPTNLPELIENYSQVKAYLDSTKYARYLDMN